MYSARKIHCNFLNRLNCTIRGIVIYHKNFSIIRNIGKNGIQ